MQAHLRRPETHIYGTARRVDAPQRARRLPRVSDPVVRHADVSYLDLEYVMADGSYLELGQAQNRPDDREGRN